MKRIDFLRKKYSNAVNIRASENDHSLIGDADVFEHLISTDPTQKKIYLEFIARCYINKQYLFEDLKRVGETLSIFDSVKSKLLVSERDIGRYSSEAQIWELLNSKNLIKIEEEALSGKASKRANKDRAHRESEVLTEDGWTIVRLDTQFAATWWGMGTRWCTTNSGGREFNYYHHKGPLRVIIRPNGAKFQMHVATGSLCNSLDSSMDIKNFEKNNKLPKFIKDIIKDDVISLCESIPLESTKQSTWYDFRLLSNLFIIIDALSNIMHSDERLKNTLEKWTKESVLIAEKEDFRIYAAPNIFVAASYRNTKDNTSPYYLIPHLRQSQDWNTEFRNIFLLELPSGQRLKINFNFDGISQMHAVFEQLPIEIQLSLLEHALKCTRKHEPNQMKILSSIINSMSTSSLSSDIWNMWASVIVAIETKIKDGYMDINYPEPLTIPDDIINEEILLIFAKGGLLERIPDRFINHRIATHLIRAKPYLINNKTIINHLKYDNFIRFATKENGKNLHLISSSQMTFEFLYDALRHSGEPIKAVLKVIKSGSVSLNGQDEKAILQKCCLIALERSSSNLSELDFEIPRELILKVISRNSSSLRWVPIKHRDLEMCKLAIKTSNTNALCHIPQWVVNELIDTSEEMAKTLRHYHPSKIYSHALTTTRKPVGPLAKMIKTLEAGVYT